MLKNVKFVDDKDFSGCSIFGMMNTAGNCFTGEDIITAIANMKDRSNGLGGGFAGYGIYPDMADHYALHMMFDDLTGRRETEQALQDYFDIEKDEPIPSKTVEGVYRPPELRRYFIKPSKGAVREGENTDDFMVRIVMQINEKIEGAFVFSSGKNMGVFKGVGYPEEIGKFFMIDEYEGYMWIGHGRFPTNTQGWWGGAHPFNVLDWSVVHNGEISSYGINKRYLEMYGYKCTLHTDTEVIAYAVDLLMRRHGLGVELTAKVLASPLWNEIERMEDEKRDLYSALRMTYGSLLLNGPFSVIISNDRQMIGLTDRIRLRPLVVGWSGDVVYISSEEAPMHLIDKGIEETRIPQGGEPVIVELKNASGNELLGAAKENRT